MNCIQMGWPNPNWLVDWQKFQNPIYKDSLDPGSLLDNKKRGLIRDKSMVSLDQNFRPRTQGHTE